MKKKHLVIVGVIILSAIVILGLYQTFALSGDITKDTSGYYNVTVTDGTTVTVPAGSTKTVYYKLTNTNKGIVKYGIGYSGTNITVEYFNDTQDPVTGTVDYGKSKYIKLSVQNSGTTSSTATLSTILGYENGGDLIVPSGVTLVTEVYTEPVIAATLITNLYNDATKTPVTNNSITYQYDTKNSLMKDNAGNIRHYGASPNNYIYFNCSDYSNQSSSTCEKWRIIGVFNGKLKLIRGSQIGTYAWDNKNTSTGAETAYGKNDWTEARLMKLLNPGYESETTGGSLYYNAKSGNCYAWQNNATKTCNFTSTGIKNDITRNLISNTTYYLGGYNSTEVYSNEIYEKERGGAVYTGRPTTWTGKIALAYPSDYGYAADLSKCSQTLYNYNDSTCTSNNWMKSIVAPNYGWLLTPNSGLADITWHVYSSGFVDYSGYYAFNANGVTPVLYLDPSVDIKSGTGSSSAPYQLSI
ncbi:MAG TPA: hypothetical protein OIM64_00690 [Bacilli bacterium]|nr:hypothetical protein [Bacilli bacterium]